MNFKEWKLSQFWKRVTQFSIFKSNFAIQMAIHSKSFSECVLKKNWHEKQWFYEGNEYLSYI